MSPVRVTGNRLTANATDSTAPATISSPASPIHAPVSTPTVTTASAISRYPESGTGWSNSSQIQVTLKATTAARAVTAANAGEWGVRGAGAVAVSGPARSVSDWAVSDWAVSDWAVSYWSVPPWS